MMLLSLSLLLLLQNENEPIHRREKVVGAIDTIVTHLNEIQQTTAV